MNLTAEQHARLAELEGRESLTEAEASELNALQHLASLESTEQDDPAPAEEPAADEPETEDPEATEQGNASEVTLFDRARAALRSRETLLAERNQAREELAQAAQRITELENRVAEQDGQILALTERANQAAELEQQIVRLEEEAADASTRAAQIAGAAHVDAEELPSASSEPVADTLDSIREQIAATSDPKEKGRLAAKAREIRKQQEAAAGALN